MAPKLQEMQLRMINTSAGDPCSSGRATYRCLKPLRKPGQSRAKRASGQKRKRRFVKAKKYGGGSMRVAQGFILPKLIKKPNAKTNKLPRAVAVPIAHAIQIAETNKLPRARVVPIARAIVQASKKSAPKRKKSTPKRKKSLNLKHQTYVEM